MKIVIIGGVAAGAKAAAKSRRMLPEAQIDIYTQDTHVSYSACGLPYYIEGNFEDWRKLIIRSVEEFEKSNIHIHTQNKVTKIGNPLTKTERGFYYGQEKRNSFVGAYGRRENEV